MAYSLQNSNNLIFTYDFITNEWNEVGFLNEMGINVHTCTTYLSKNNIRYYFVIQVLVQKSNQIKSFFREVLVMTIPEQIYDWQDVGNDLTKMWRIEIPSYKSHVSFLNLGQSALAGALTIHRGILHLFLVPNPGNLLGYYFKNTNSWKMRPISLTSKIVAPYECDSLVFMCSRDKFAQMTLIDN